MLPNVAWGCYHVIAIFNLDRSWIWACSGLGHTSSKCFASGLSQGHWPIARAVPIGFLFLLCVVNTWILKDQFIDKCKPWRPCFGAHAAAMTSVCQCSHMRPYMRCPSSLWWAFLLSDSFKNYWEQCIGKKSSGNALLRLRMTSVRRWSQLYLCRQWFSISFVVLLQDSRKSCGSTTNFGALASALLWLRWHRCVSARVCTRTCTVRLSMMSIIVVWQVQELFWNMCWKEKCWQCAAAAASDCGSSLVAALLVHAEEESVGELRLARPPQARYKFSGLGSFY